MNLKRNTIINSLLKRKQKLKFKDNPIVRKSGVVQSHFSGNFFVDQNYKLEAKPLIMLKKLVALVARLR